MSQNEIQVGDTVICTDDADSFGRLRDGNTYTVTANFDGSPTVMVNGSAHMLERFRKVEPTAGDAFLKGWDLLATTDGGEVIKDLDDYALRRLAIRAWDLSNTGAVWSPPEPSR